MQENRFAAARAAHDPHHFTGKYIQIDMIVNQLISKAVHHAAHRNNGCFLGHADQKSSCTKTMAKIASARITRKIACTTATVVKRPSSREESRTSMPR